jgi:hypothetical protein
LFAFYARFSNTEIPARHHEMQLYSFQNFIDFLRSGEFFLGLTINSLYCFCYLPPGRVNKLLAMSTLRHGPAVRLLTGHIKLRAHLYKLGQTEREEFLLCGYDQEGSVHIVCDCHALAGKRYRIWGSMFLRPEDLETVVVGSLLKRVANTGLGLVS